MAKGASINPWKIVAIVLACFVGLQLLGMLAIWTLWWPSCDAG